MWPIFSQPSLNVKNLSVKRMVVLMAHHCTGGPCSCMGDGALEESTLRNRLGQKKPSISNLIELIRRMKMNVLRY